MLELSPKTFHELAAVIREETGIALGLEKSYLVRHRLEPLVISEGLETFELLVQRLRMRAPTRLLAAVVDAITVKETRFFRDHAFFDLLQSHVLPECALKLQGSGRQRVRIWSAASSTGQEAYSVAMLVREFAEINGTREGQFSILASDISAQAIEFAKAGQYTRAEVDRGVSEARLKKHFDHRGAKWHIDESLAKLIHFRTHNLMSPSAELGPFDVILCRNVLIYFDEAARRRICHGLYSALHPGGWLALGSAESLYGAEAEFETIPLGKILLYRKPQRAS